MPTTVRHNEERLKISKVAKFESDMSEASEDEALQRREIYFKDASAYVCMPAMGSL